MCRTRPHQRRKVAAKQASTPRYMHIAEWTCCLPSAVRHHQPSTSRPGTANTAACLQLCGILNDCRLEPAAQPLVHLPPCDDGGSAVAES